MTTSDATAAITVGVTGTLARWGVSPWGAVTDLDGSTVDWFVAAEDRWHRPGEEATVRQDLLDGAPVVETRLAVPGGDVLQRVWTVSDGGGTTLLEFENASPRAVAVAVTGPVVADRERADVPVEGIELPDDAIVLPLGHRSTVRVALATDGDGGGVRRTTVTSAPPPMAVARGWRTITDRASRLALPDAGLADAVTRARCVLLLDGPLDADTDPTGFLLDVAEMVRCGEPADAWLVECVEPAERVARSGGADVVAALEAVRSIARRAGDRRAVADVDRIAARSAAGTSPPDPATVADLRAMWDRPGSRGRFVRAVESRLARSSAPGEADLCPGGVPSEWWGNDFEVHGLPTGSDSSVSFAVRWHGARPALLWEQTGTPVHLTATDASPGWSTSDAAGETLWSAPERPAVRRRSIDLSADD